MKDWGKWRTYRAMRFRSLSDEELIACETCGRPTDALETKRCDGCWEVEHRLSGYLQDGGRVAAIRLIDALSSYDDRFAKMAAVIAQARNVSPKVCGAAGVLHERLKELDELDGGRRG